MRHLEDADRAEHERARELRPEHLDRGVARRDVAQHARDDSPALERGPVLAHRLFGAGASCHVGEALGRHRAPRRALERLEGDGNARVHASGASDVDLELALAPDPDGHGCTLTPGARESARDKLPDAEAGSRQDVVHGAARGALTAVRVSIRRHGPRWSPTAARPRALALSRTADLARP